jgi:non-ribosomal peptide synthetase component E (peptide arylation enzyme)
MQYLLGVPTIGAMDTAWAVATARAAGDWLATADPRAVAVADRHGALDYAGLRARVADRLVELDLSGRLVVVLAGERSIEYVVTYLALLTGGHVPILAAGHAERLAHAWGSPAVVRADEDGWTIARPGTRSGLQPVHPDLALLLSTSGSTGSPKLVRLSHANLAANAAAIAESLRITTADRAITALPLHYCYGLSVLHSHLAVGAAVVIETASVVDPCFAAALERHAVTNLAAVPHTLDLLEHAGPARIRVPSLRLLTHAGGRLDRRAAERWLDRTERWGVEFVQMYGQTEATARMAVLPSGMARRHPGVLGVPVPGGALAVEPVADLPAGVPPGTGEIVYRGPNVMMGYAETPADLARGAEVAELRTGDLAVGDPATGMLALVGRRSRFVKPFGVRIDLDQVERELIVAGLAGDGPLAVAGDDTTLVVAAPGAHLAHVQAHVASLTALPASRVSVIAELPRTAAGKPDYPAVLALGATTEAEPDDRGVAAVLAAVLGVTEIGPDDTFVARGGDSLSYVEAALRLEPLLGRLPTDWHFRKVAELEALAVTGGRVRGSLRRAVRWTDTTAVLRAVGICAVVLTHMRWAYVPGGAHVMLAVVGYNLSRFLLPVEGAAERVRLGLRTVARVAVPTVLWVAAGMFLFGSYSPGTLLLVNNYVGPRGHRDDHWHFWFVEVFVHLVVLMLIVLAVPAARRAERRWPYAVPLALVGVGVLLRQEWAQGGDWYNLRFRTHGVLLFFALGWLVERTDTTRRRLVTSAVIGFAVADTFNLPHREVFIGACLVLLLWCREVPLPWPLARLVAVVASASMWILITHFTVYPWLMARLPIESAYVATLAAGVAAWWVVERATRLAIGWRALRGRVARRHTNLLVPVGSVA